LAPLDVLKIVRNADLRCPSASARQADLLQIARIGDLVMFSTLVASELAALAIGQYYGGLGLAVGLGGCCWPWAPRPSPWPAAAGWPRSR
jgi:hypothetical protein